MGLVFVGLILSVILVLYLYFTRNFNYWKERNIKGPKPVPLFGNIKDGALRRKTYHEIFAKIHEEFPNEKVVGVYRMTTPNLLIRDPEIIKNIFIKDYDNFITRGVRLHEKDVSAALFHTNGVTWRGLRGKYTRMFTTQKLKSMTPSIVESADRFMIYLNKIVYKKPDIAIHKAFKRFSIAAIAASSFTLDASPEDEKFHEIMTGIDDLLMNLNIVNEIDMMYPSFLAMARLSVFPKALTDFYGELSKKMIAERNGIPSKNDDFLDVLLRMQNKKYVEVSRRYNDDEEITFEVTDKVIAGQMFQFFAAGYETTATSLGLLCYLLATNEDVKKKVVNEIETKLKAHNNVVTYEYIKDLVYLENVLLETLRLYPIVDPLQRMAEEDYYVPEVDLTIKKGTIVFVSAAGLHNDPKYYPEPKKFKPERFDDPKLKEMMQLIYLSFGSGPRYCVGIRHAKIQVKVVLTKFLMKYDIQPSANTPIPMRFRPYRLMLTPVDGMPLKIVPRKMFNKFL